MAFGETIAGDEEDRFRRFAEDIAALARRRSEERGVPSRALHVKQHVGAVGEIVVTAPEEARFGVFAEPGKRWPVYARFSNGSGGTAPDQKPDARGFALKLVGVPGKKLIPGMEDEVTQDFLTIDTPAIPMKDPDEFMAFVRAAKDGPGKLVPRLISSLGLGRTLAILWRSLTNPSVASYATHAFNTAVPVAFGPTAAKLGLVPAPDQGVPPSVDGPDYLRDDLVARLRRGSLSWSVRVQPFVDQKSTPIEDSSVAWVGPWVEVGTLTLPRQDPESERGKEISELVNRLSFDPWHATEEHRPLGAIMRARRVAYAPSVIGRNAAAEPRSVLEP
jgi:hypothetical protein